MVQGGGLKCGIGFDAVADGSGYLVCLRPSKWEAALICISLGVATAKISTCFPSVSCHPCGLAARPQAADYITKAPSLLVFDVDYGTA